MLRLRLALTALVIASFYTSISGVVKAEVFPSTVRALGVGFTYAVGNALFGGTAEYVALVAQGSRPGGVVSVVCHRLGRGGVRGLGDDAGYAAKKLSRRDLEGRQLTARASPAAAA